MNAGNVAEWETGYPYIKTLCSKTVRLQCCIVRQGLSRLCGLWGHIAWRVTVGTFLRSHVANEAFVHRKIGARRGATAALASYVYRGAADLAACRGRCSGAQGR